MIHQPFLRRRAVSTSGNISPAISISPSGFYDFIIQPDYELPMNEGKTKFEEDQMASRPEGSRMRITP